MRHIPRQGTTPSDSTGAPGTTQYVEWVNDAIAVFNKRSGVLEAGPIPGNQLFQRLGGGCATSNDGDPIVRFDQIGKRWFLEQFVVTSPYKECLAVSATDDARGPYRLYAIPEQEFGDYPKLSLWGAYVLETFVNATSGRAASICALPKSALFAGKSARAVCSQFAGLPPVLTADVDGPTEPQAGTPVPVIALSEGLNGSWPHLYSLLVSPEMAKLQLIDNGILASASFTPACGAAYVLEGNSAASCVPEPGTGALGALGTGPAGLDPLSDRPMFRLVWRQIAGRQLMTFTHSVDAWPKAVSGVRWYVLQRDHVGSWQVIRKSTFAPDGISRWMSSSAFDRQGNVLIGYTASDALSTFPGLRVAGARASRLGDTLEKETIVANGLGAQIGASMSNRWGDYSQMSIDPIDDCTFYYVGQYSGASGLFNWRTRIASFRFEGC